MSSIIAQGAIQSITVDGQPWLPQSAGATTQAAFEAALRAAYANDTVLNWLNGDVRITSPILINVTSSKSGHGLNMNGANIICDFNDASRYAILYIIPTSPTKTFGITAKIPNITNATFWCASPAAGAIYLECFTNGSWIYGFHITGCKFYGFTWQALYFHGSVFEFFVDNCTFESNKWGIMCRNSGVVVTDPGYTDTDVGVVSAVFISNCTFRDGTDTAIVLDGSQPYRETKDITCTNCYFVDNAGYGLWAPSGWTLLMACGFENNGGVGAGGVTEGRMIACRGASDGRMPFLMQIALTGADADMVFCRIEQEGGTGSIQFCHATGTGQLLTVGMGTTAYTLDAGVSLLSVTWHVGP